MKSSRWPSQKSAPKGKNKLQQPKGQQRVQTFFPQNIFVFKWQVLPSHSKHTRYFWPYSCLCFPNLLSKSSDFFLLTDTPLKRDQDSVLRGIPRGWIWASNKIWVLHGSKYSSPLDNYTLSTLACFPVTRIIKLSLASGPLYMLLFLKPFIFLSSSLTMQGQVLTQFLA